MSEQFRVSIVEVTEPVKLHLCVKQAYPHIYKMKAGMIGIGEFLIAYGIVEAQRVRKTLEDGGAKAKIESV